jgi:hypothetical protein
MCATHHNHRTGNCHECSVEAHSAREVAVNAPITDMPQLWDGDDS